MTANESTYSDSNTKTIGHIRTVEVMKSPYITLTNYEKKYIIVTNILLELFGKHQKPTHYFDLDLWHRQLWGMRTEKILNSLEIHETEEIH